MKSYRIRYIDGCDLEYHVHDIPAETQREAIDKLWSDHPIWGENAFEHHVVSAEECETQPLAIRALGYDLEIRAMPADYPAEEGETRLYAERFMDFVRQALAVAQMWYLDHSHESDDYFARQRYNYGYYAFEIESQLESVGYFGNKSNEEV